MAGAKLARARESWNIALKRRHTKLRKKARKQNFFMLHCDLSKGKRVLLQGGLLFSSLASSYELFSKAESRRRTQPIWLEKAHTGLVESLLSRLSSCFFFVCHSSMRFRAHNRETAWKKMKNAEAIKWNLLRPENGKEIQNRLDETGECWHGNIAWHK